MSDDDKFDEFLRDAARDYNQPPPVPRAEIWSRIAQVRAGQRAGDVVRAPQPRNRWLIAAIAMAAMLVLGIALGRWTYTNSQHEKQIAKAPVQGGVAPQPDSADSATGARPEERGPERIRTPRAEYVHNDDGANSNALTYRLAVIQHLGQTEALLTTVRVGARSGHMDVQVGRWARSLLSTTQLLIDSPAADDQQLKKLLGDLELVLTQIARLQPGRDSTDIDLIEQAISQQDVLTRIRTTIPAGRGPAGS